MDEYSFRRIVTEYLGQLSISLERIGAILETFLEMQSPTAPTQTATQTPLSEEEDIDVSAQ